METAGMENTGFGNVSHKGPAQAITGIKGIEWKLFLVFFSA
jgi:hypothetical protein